MSRQHTPGPWCANHCPPDIAVGLRALGACAVWTADGKVPICFTRGRLRQWNDVPAETQDANCRLIAAAPDLLAACDMVIQYWGTGLPLSGEVLDTVSAAIGKARGQA